MRSLDKNTKVAGFTPRTKNMFERACEFALCDGAGAMVGTEHMLLAILDDEDSIAFRILKMLGADISAEAVRRAARQVPEGIFCAASTAHLPLAAESLDLIVNIFSPLMAEEFLRVLKPGGYLLRVVPMERHLFELKAAVYDRPYENPPAEPAVEGFRLLRTQTLRKTITLSSNEDVQALFLMTPYYYKTGAEDQQKLAAVPSLRVTTEFLIAVCQKP